MKKDLLISVENIYKAKVRLKHVAHHTPLMKNSFYSEKYQCNLYLKREDLQVVRSYKIRGAYNKMATLSKKIKKVKSFGKSFVKVQLIGDTYDDSYNEAIKDARKNKLPFIHPFNDEKVIEGQGTVGLEIMEDCEEPIDYIFVAIGGGGIISGLGSYFRHISPKTKIIGVEPTGSPGMYQSMKMKKVVTLKEMDVFIDGAAVKKVGDLTFKIAQQVIDDIVLVPEGKVCTKILELYNEEAIVVEPAGALTIGALDFYNKQIKGKTVVCLIGGGNNDITRMEDIKERSLLYEGLKHYFIVQFPQRAGALKSFLNDILGPNDDITHFEYTKKNNKDSGPALVGIELKNRKDYKSLIKRMKAQKIEFQTMNDQEMLFRFLV